jgi:formamidopyrimidine-DNA glycosylase
MPELPEVETVCRGLARVLTGASFTKITLRRKDLRFPLPPRLEALLKNQKITALERRAKYILMHFAHGKSLLLHLGMSGRMVMDDGTEPLQKHDHVVFLTDKGLRVRFNDARRFGMMDVVDSNAAQEHKLLRHLGAEPFAENFTGAYLHEKLKGKKTAVKLAIMDQEVVVGVGNIYASEALYDAGISPLRAGGKITKAEAARLVADIRKVLQRSIEKGGSTLRDYVQADGGLGYFQHEFAVYGRTGESCKRCGKPCITRIQQGGRSTFFCAKTQK